MESYGRGRGRGGGRTARGGVGGRGRERGQYDNAQHGGTSNPSNYHCFPGRQREYRSVSGQDWRSCSGVGGSSGSGRGGGVWKINYATTSSRNSGSGSDAPTSELRSLEISYPLQPSPPPESGEIVPIRRPDNGGTSYGRKVHLLVNHFAINFNRHMTMLLYNIDAQPEVPSKHGGSSRVSNSDIRVVKNKIFSDDLKGFPPSMTAYDGGKIILSAVKLPTEKVKVDVPKGEAVKSYIFNVELVKELQLRELTAYLEGRLPVIPRAILQGLDLVMKENPKKHRVQVGQGFYSMRYNRGDDLGCGVVACKGFQQSLKLTSQGPVLCVDFSVLPFRKPVPVLQFLQERLPGFNADRIDYRKVEKELKGLKVSVTHRETKQKFTIKGLTGPTESLIFTLEDRDGINPPQKVRVVDYFRNKYSKEIKFKNLPCLDLGKNGKSNVVPMEFCVLVEGQRYPKDHLDKYPSKKLKDMSLPKPWERKNFICDAVQASDGPLRGDTACKFEIEANLKMTEVVGRVLGVPNLKLGDTSGACKFTPNTENGQWNLVDKSVLQGKDIERWAVLDFSSDSLIYEKFIHKLMTRCRTLGILMKPPLFHELSDMRVLSDTDRLRKLLNHVYQKANHQLQILFCPMTYRHHGYNALKWICETQVGIVTQCCLSDRCNMGKDDYLANLALKINTKLGGNNFELFDRLPGFESDDHVMFIGADVNHPSPGNGSSPSIAAVVSTVNWPGANKYVARYRLQKHRSEKILELGEMCLDLINKYVELNKVKPNKIIVFRDGVSDNQFDMVLNEELMDLKKAIQCDGYSPTITLVIAQKRHHTRLFPVNEKQGARGGNVFPGTVVDTTIVHPWGYDFYLCSHYGLLGTSNPTHYYCLWDDHKFSSDALQKIINNLCYTFARSTKPVSLVPPAYYASNLAYRVRQYYEAWESDSATSSSLSSSSPFSLQFDPKNFKMHGDLENVMFFC
ncbi:hypothetical protein NE237_001614 [Protea cynaroides]|uniref:Argonaute 2 n=1 Tax=Protea cynaroides TaxID=273540 RepID=A0A9Q0KTG5_9MAGN|nr:hypothetical protein NE237_001614 [Protea cynaroides]